MPKNKSNKYGGKQVTPTIDEEDYVFYVSQKDEEEVLFALNLRQESFEDEDRVQKFW
jgi:hypothetical protein